MSSTQTQAKAEPTYRLWVNEKSTILARLWSNGQMEVATRQSPAHVWGPPIFLEEEPTS